MTGKYNPDRIRKSLGAENTFAEDYDDIGQMKIYLESLANEVSHRLNKAKTGGRTDHPESSL